MATEIFVDTSGFFALLAAKDDRHDQAVACLHAAANDAVRFVTTDYVLDEMATLLQARGMAHLLPAFFASVLESKVCRVEWMDAELFGRAKTFFLRHSDKSYSFTDCASFCTMQVLGLRQALTKDAHFSQAGFSALLNDTITGA
jgi:predicted nucleic acid-binding protein